MQGIIYSVSIFILVFGTRISGIYSQQNFTTTTEGYFTTTTTKPPNCGLKCEDGWVQFGNKCLKLRYIGETFGRAYNICLDYQATLVSIESVNEQILLEQLLVENLNGNSTATTNLFLYTGGIRCPHNGYTWLNVDGKQTQLQYTNWDVNQPNMDTSSCLVFNYGAKYSTTYTYGRWFGTYCSAKYPYICQKPARVIY